MILEHSDRIIGNIFAFNSKGTPVLIPRRHTL
jgi:hypothetical protein